MLTVDTLKTWGASVSEGLQRCMNNENFYLRLVKKALDDANFGKLRDAFAAGDEEAAFQAAHGLKGILANLALTPMLDLVSEMTEQLRGHTEMDYAPALEKLLALRDELKAMSE